MAADQPFIPHYGSNQVQTLAAATAAPFTIAKGDDTVIVTNTGTTNKLYFCTYDSAGTARVASTTDKLVLPGVESTVSKPLEHDRISLISAGGTTVEFMTGRGW